MQAEQIIQSLNKNDTTERNRVLRHINNTMKAGVLKNLSTPAFVDKNEIWNLALLALWKSVCVKGKGFRIIKKDAIQRFLYIVCKRQVLKNISYHKRNRTESLEDIAWTTIVSDDNIDKLLMQMEALEHIQALMRKHVNETEWQVLIHKYFDMMSYEEMSEVMDKSPNSLKTTKHRTMNKVKLALHKDAELQAYIRFLLGKPGIKA